MTGNVLRRFTLHILKWIFDREKICNCTSTMVLTATRIKIPVRSWWIRKQSSFSIRSFAFEEQITNDSFKCFSNWFVASLKRDVSMFHPRCSTLLLILDGRKATALTKVVVVGGTTCAVLLGWITDGEKDCLITGLSGTRGNSGLIWNQAWWWCDALCDYYIAVHGSVLRMCKYNRWKTVLPIKYICCVQRLCRTRVSRNVTYLNPLQLNTFQHNIRP